MIVAVVASSLTFLLVIVVVVAVLLCWRRCSIIFFLVILCCPSSCFHTLLRYSKERNRKNMVKIDWNHDYNLYYTPDGERLDEGICETVDTNYYYGK